MSDDAAQHPPLGTYLTIGEAEWTERGWMQFSTSGSTRSQRGFSCAYSPRGKEPFAHLLVQGEACEGPEIDEIGASENAN
jgi:hypothetical protein